MALAVNPVALMALAKDARSAAWQVTLSLFIKRSVILYCTFLFAYNVFGESRESRERAEREQRESRESRENRENRENREQSRDISTVDRTKYVRRGLLVSVDLTRMVSHNRPATPMPCAIWYLSVII